MRTRRVQETAPALLAFFWPAIYLAPFLAPHGLQSRNDFGELYFKYKVYLLDALAFEQRIPGWSPSEACGYPFLANPFVAALYPLNLPLALVYRLAGGHSQFIHQIFTVVGLCIFSLGLYSWLRESGAGVRAALVAALVMGTSLKMTELQRFPNAMHAAAWFPWLLLGVAWCRRRATRLQGTGLIAASGILLATAGYPYFLYYAQFLVLPYAAAIVWPRTRAILIASEEDRPSTRESLWTSGAIAGGLAASLLVSWPYLSAVRSLLALTTDRGGGDLEFATQYSQSVLSTIGSLVFPPAASAEGWFYFGQLPLLLLVLFVAGALDPETRRRDRALAMTTLTYALVVASLTWGAHSPTFRIMSAVWPGFRQLRAWPRLQVIVVPVLALLLARAWESFERLANGSDANRSGRSRLLRTGVAAVAAVLAIQGVFLATGYTHVYWQKLLGPAGIARAWGYPPAAFPIFAAVAGMLLLLALSWSTSNRKAPHRDLLAAGFVVFAACDTAGLGLSQWASRRDPSDLVLMRANVASTPFESLTVPRKLERDTIQIGAKYNTGVIPNWYFRSYIDFLRESAGLGPDEKLRMPRVAPVPGISTLLGLDDGRRFFFVPGVA
ncbi:MAG TPA: hypothetical protein VKG23_14675, partial [Thermoanaerobaculia bacterium]|nr:hypothetical protein [Thermoanaerobaculia bacterium]